MYCKIIIIAVLIFLTGCMQNGSDFDIKSCPPKSISKEQLLSDIGTRQADMQEFAARGSAKITFLSDNRSESLSNVTAYFTDTNNALVRAGHAFGTAITLGANGDDFWCWINFAKVNEFYYGDVSKLENCGGRGFKTFPIAEAFGVIDIESLRGADMFFEEREFGLVSYDNNYLMQRSYSFDNCTGELVRITYYDGGHISAVSNFFNYQPLNGQMSLPAKVVIFSVSEAVELEITLPQITKLSLSQSRRERIYSMPSKPSGATIYELNTDCEFQMR